MMRKKIILSGILMLAMSAIYAQVGIGEPTPANRLSVKGAAGIGSYSGTSAPNDGVIISGQVGIGTSSPNSAAVLDITSTTQGLLYPRMDSTHRMAIPNPAQGLMVFDTSTRCLEFFVGTVWQPVACGCIAAPSPPYAINGSNFDTLCYSTPYAYSIPDVAGASSYIWSVPGDSGAVITGQGTTSVTISFSNNSGATGISVRSVNSCGTGFAFTTPVAFKPVPSAYGAGINGLPLVVCPATGGTATLTAPAYTPHATSYSWSLPAGITAVGSTTSPSITVDVPTTSGQVYTLSVSAGDCIGTGSATTGTITTIGPPTAPTGLFASSYGTSFTASWNASTSSGAIAGYYLDVSTSSTFATFLTGYNNKNVGNVLTYNITGLTCGTAYYFRVRAYDACSPSQTSSNSSTYTVSGTPHGKKVFAYTGATQTFTAPCSATTLTVKIWGGGGGPGYYGSGGGSGYVTGTYSIPADTVLTILIGGGGSANQSGTAAVTYGGGGKGVVDNNNFEPSGNGGGYTYIRRNGPVYIAVAGGGGGGGGYSDYYEGSGTNANLIPCGGPGGGTTGGNGYDGGLTSGAYGRGGTATAGGAAGSAGTGATAATAGAAASLGNGGTGGGKYDVNNVDFVSVFGGGGGGGYYSGGGGGGSYSGVTNCGGGGGGSSYTGGLSGATNTQASTSDLGENYPGGNPPPNATDSDYLNNPTGTSLFGGNLYAGWGGDSFFEDNGQPGLVVLIW